MKKLFLTLVLGLICAVGFSQFTMEDGTYTYTNEFTTENVRDFSYMFSQATSLQKINFGTKFNKSRFLLSSYFAKHII